VAARRVADRQALRRGRPDGSGACRAGCQAGSRLCGRATCASLRIAGRRETSKRPTARSRHFTARLPAPAPHRPPLTMGRSCLAAPSVHRHSLGLPVVRSTTRPTGAGAAASPRSSSSALRQAPLCFGFTSPCRVCQATPTAPRRRNELRAEGSQRHDGRRQENAGRPPGSTRPAGASPIANTLREPQRSNPWRARNGGYAPRPPHLTTGNFPSAAPGPRPVARAPDSRCGRPEHRARWPAPGRRYPAHCG